jgi:hypothetical protein
MAEDYTSNVQRRAHFRVRYPAENAPRIIISGTPYVILDISERGAKLSNPLRRRLPDDLFTAFVWLHDGQPIKVIAKVVRLDPNFVALYFAQGIPYTRILTEQVYIKNIKSK